MPFWNKTIFAIALIPAMGFAQNKISTHLVTEGDVERIGTSLDHASIITLPEPVTNALVGSDDIHLETRANVVVLEPNEPGIRTNLFIWTKHFQLSYDVLPAQKNTDISYVIHEIVPPPAPPPPGPTPQEAQVIRDKTNAPFLLSSRVIKAPHYKDTRTGINLRVEQVAEDKFSFYVRLHAVNRTSHAYRASTPSVNHIVPTFGEKMAVRSINEQLTQRKFNKVLLYDAEPLIAHGSTLVPHDLRPGQTSEWAMAIPKPEHMPAMYEFVMPDDDGIPVHAVVVF